MGKTITNKEYLQRLKDKNLEVEPIENYIKATTPIMHRCLKHNVCWKISPSNVLKGKGCSQCRSEKIRNKFLKTHEQYIKDLQEKNPNLEAVEKYIDTKTPILHKCKKHNISWKILPSNALKGCGCNECKIEKIIQYNLKTHEQYVNELKETNPHIIVKEEYCGCDVPILHYCTIHDIEYKTAPKDAQINSGCPQCSLEKFQKSTRFSHEEYLSLLSIKNPDIVPLENYINSKTKILHFCNTHNYKWKTTPFAVLSGNGCPRCKSEKISKKLTLSNEEYIQRLKNINKNVIPIEKYIGMKTPILHKCLVHCYKWNVSPENILNDVHRCPKCIKEEKDNSFLQEKNQYIEDLKESNPNLKLIEEYKGKDIEIKHQCIKHNIIWKIKPYSAAMGTGCEYCRREKIGKFFKKNHEQYVRDVKIISKNIDVVEQYINSSTPIMHHCKKHNENWKATPRLILTGHCGCKKCHGEKISKSLVKSQKEYINEVEKTNPFILVEGDYINAHTSILHKCLLDDFKWYAKPNNILSGTGCPKCNQSKGERKIASWLYQNNISYKCQYIFNDCKDEKPLPFDFYLPYYNIAIEYDGEQHFRPVDFFGGKEKFKKQLNHDRTKDEFCKNNGITLLRIPYFNYNFIEEELNNFLFN